MKFVILNRFTQFFFFFSDSELIFLPKYKNGVTQSRFRGLFLVIFFLGFLIFFTILIFTTAHLGLYISKKIQIKNLFSYQKKKLTELHIISQNINLLRHSLQQVVQNGTILEQFSNEETKKNRFGIGGPEISLLQKMRIRRKFTYSGHFFENKEFQKNDLPAMNFFENLSLIKSLHFKEKDFLNDNNKLFSFINKKKELFWSIPSYLPLKVYNTQHTYEILEKKDSKKGIFIRIPTTTDVLSTSSGVVENILTNSDSGRYSLFIFHSMGIKSEYHNLLSCQVFPGDIVKVKQVIGTADYEILYRVKLGNSYEPAVKFLSKNL